MARTQQEASIGKGVCSLTVIQINLGIFKSKADSCIGLCLLLGYVSAVGYIVPWRSAMKEE